MRRKKKIVAEEELARKQALLDQMERSQRARVTRSLNAGEFSFIKKDRERQKQRETESAEAKKKRKADESALLFRAREVELYGTENWEDISKRQDAERKQRVEARASRMQTESRLPARMEMHEALKAQAGHVIKESAAERTRKKLAMKEEKAKVRRRVDNG